MKVTMIPICNWCSSYCYQRISTRTGGLVNKRTSVRPSNYYINWYRQEYWEESIRMRRFLTTHTLVRSHQLALMGKSLIREQILLLLLLIIIIIIKWEEKQLYGHFKPTDKRHIIQENYGCGEESETLKRETEYLLIATQNNIIRTNHIKARIW